MLSFGKVWCGISETVGRVLDNGVIGNAPLATATEIPHSDLPVGILPQSCFGMSHSNDLLHQLELEPEAYLSAVGTSERRAISLAPAITRRIAKGGAQCAVGIVKSLIHIIAAVVPVKQVIHLRHYLQFQAFPEVKFLRGAEIQLDQ